MLTPKSLLTTSLEKLHHKNIICICVGVIVNIQKVKRTYCAISRSTWNIFCHPLGHYKIYCIFNIHSVLCKDCAPKSGATLLQFTACKDNCSSFLLCLLAIWMGLKQSTDSHLSWTGLNWAELDWTELNWTEWSWNEQIRLSVCPPL